MPLPIPGICYCSGCFRDVRLFAKWNAHKAIEFGLAALGSFTGRQIALEDTTAVRPHLKGSFLSILRLIPLLLIILAGLQCRRDIGDLLRDKKVVSVKSNTAAQQINTDINGDGYADMVVGAPNGGDPLNAGLVYVLYGSSSGIQNPPTDGCDYAANRCTEIENPADESSGGFSGFGGSYALAGDVNGDGYGDVIVAGPNNGMSNTPAGMVDNRGAVYVFYGSATGVRANPQDTGSSEYVCNGVAAGCTMVQHPLNENGSFGLSVDAAGDINGDGYADVLASANTSNSGEGKAYVLLGSASGVVYRPFSGTADACSLPHCVELSNPNTTYSNFGRRVAPAGDVNGDGVSDMMVSTTDSEGSFYVFYGSSAGISSRLTPNYSCTGIADGCVAVGNPVGGTGRFGRVLSAADFNRDGFSDIIAGSHFNASVLSGKGAVFVYYGSATGIAHRPPGTTYTCSGNCTEIQNPDQTGNGWFGYWLAASKDLNGDGYADVVIGAPRNDTNQNGVAYVYYGSATGLPAFPAAGSGSAAYSCSGTGTCTAIYSPRTGIGINFGTTVFAPGDLNGDGLGDLWIGSFSGNTSGTATAYYGDSGGITAHGTSGYTCSGVPDCTETLYPRTTGLGYYSTYSD